jgi:hypothetical protein
MLECVVVGNWEKGFSSSWVKILSKSAALIAKFRSNF